MHHMQYQYMQNKNDTNVIIVTGKYSNVKIRIKQINCGLKKEYFESEIFFYSMIIVSVGKQAYMAYKSRLNIKLKFIE